MSKPVKIVLIIVLLAIAGIIGQMQYKKLYPDLGKSVAPGQGGGGMMMPGMPAGGPAKK